MAMVICVVGRCITRPPSPEYAFLFEEAPLTFVQSSIFCGAAESFQDNRLPVCPFIRIFWKILPGQWNMTRHNGHIWLVGCTRYATVPPAGSCGIFKGDRLPGGNPLHARHWRYLFADVYLIGRFFIRNRGTCPFSSALRLSIVSRE